MSPATGGLMAESLKAAGGSQPDAQRSCVGEEGTCLLWCQGVGAQRFPLTMVENLEGRGSSGTLPTGPPGAERGGGGGTLPPNEDWGSTPLCSGAAGSWEHLPKIPRKHTCPAQRVKSV